jgi:hypothetical protein
MTTSAANFVRPGTALKSDANPRTFQVPEDEEESVFNYTETASDRVRIGALTERLKPEVVAIIGLSGTSGYVLGFVAKTKGARDPAFDADQFLQHLHPDRARLRISGGRARLVQSSRAVVAIVEELEAFVSDAW